MFSPNEATLAQLITLLQAADNPDSAIQQNLVKNVNQLYQQPDGLAYLGHVLFNSKDLSPHVRQFAGLVLKNRFTRADEKDMAPITNDLANYLAEQAVDVVRDPQDNKEVRETAGTVISSILSKIDDIKPPILHTLLRMTSDSQEEVAQHGLDALYKVFEDMFEVSATPFLNNEVRRQAADGLLQSSLTLLGSEQTHIVVRRRALDVVNLFSFRSMFASQEPFEAYFTPYVAALRTCAVLNDPELMVLILRGFLGVLEYRPKDIVGDEKIFQYFLQASAHPTYDVRLVALEFWPAAITLHGSYQIILQLMPMLCEILLRNMKYSPADYLSMNENALQNDNRHVPDQLHETGHAFRRGEDDFSDSDDNEPAVSCWGSQWTARKYAALAFDRLATMHTDGLLNAAFQYVLKLMASEDWETRESGFLALGAMMPAAQRSLESQPPGIPGLLAQIYDASKSPHPLLRSISVWTLSRFKEWVTEQRDPNIIMEMTRLFLNMCCDTNKQVQEAAISAFAFFEEDATVQLVPHVPDICGRYRECYAIYQKKNKAILLDAISTLFDVLGPSHLVGRPEFLDLMQVVVADFLGMNYDTYELIAMVELLVSTAVRFRGHFREVAIRILPRTAEMAMMAVQILEAARDPNSSVDPRADVLDVFVDLMGALVGTLGDRAPVVLASLADGIQGCIQKIATEAPMRSMYSLQQALCGLIGDIVRVCPQLFTPIASTTVPVVCERASVGTGAAIHNSAWCLASMAQFCEPAVLEPFVELAVSNMLNKVLPGYPVSESAACTCAQSIASIGAIFPERTLAVVTNNFKYVAAVVDRSRTDSEKAHAAWGICLMAHTHPALLTENLTHIISINTSVLMVPPPPPGTSPAVTSPEIEAKLREFMSWLFKHIDTKQALDSCGSQLLDDVRSTFKVELHD